MVAVLFLDFKSPGIDSASDWASKKMAERSALSPGLERIVSVLAEPKERLCGALFLVGDS